MADEIKIRVGKKVSDAELRTIDPKEIGRLQSQPKQVEVQGEHYFSRYVLCPGCGCVNVIPREDVCTFGLCHCCGSALRY
jgi:hypothetical protein